MKPLLVVILGGAGLYLALGLTIFLFQDSLIFQPDPDAGTPAGAGPPPAFEIEVKTADGLTLRHYLVPSGDPEAPVVVVLHGGRGSALARWDKFSPLVASGLGLVLAEYRGYGGNPGRPSEEGFLEDARSLVRYLGGAPGIPPSRIVLYGESLGAAVAAGLAEEVPLRGLVLEGAFTSYSDLAQSRFPLYPAHWLFRQHFDVLGPLSRLEVPLLLLHGEDDEVVPVAHGQRLLEAAQGAKRGVFLPGAKHDQLADFGIMQIVADFIGQLLPPSGRTTP